LSLPCRYADSPFLLKIRIPASSEKVERYFNLQKSRPDYASFAGTTPIVGVEDDHDAGINDAFSGNMRENATRYLLDFLDEPKDSERYKRVSERNEAAYASYTWGEKPRRVHMILLDNRSKRDQYGSTTEQDFLGENQWSWLYDELKNTEAEITIIGAGLQIISRGDPDIAESWSKLGQSQAKLFAMLAELKKGGVFFISGDVHFTELNRAWLQYQAESAAWTMPLYDFTCSGLTHSWGGLLKTTVVRSALMHTHRVREDGITLGEERECGEEANDSEERETGMPKPLYCQEALKREHEQPGSAFRIQPGPWSTGLGLGFRRKNTRGSADPSLQLESVSDYLRATISSGVRDLFSSEQNFGEIDIKWATTTSTTDPGANNNTGVQEEVIDLDHTVITFRAIGLLGDVANQTLYEYSFPLRHIYPSKVTPPEPAKNFGPVSDNAAGSVQKEGAVVRPVEGTTFFKAFRMLIHSWFLTSIHPDGDRSPLLMNGYPVPASTAGSVASTAADAHGCACAPLNSGFTEVCGRFMAFVGPHLALDDSIRYGIGHAAIFAAGILGIAFFAATPIAIWVYRRQLNAAWPVPMFLRGPIPKKDTATRARTIRSGVRDSRATQAKETVADGDDRGPWMWYALYFALLAGAAAYLYSLG
jgi:PhoD-like phosphatase